MKKKILLGIGIPLAVIAVLGIAGFLAFRGMTASLNAMMAEEIPILDFTAVPDGEYEGTKEAGPVKVVVKVEVSGGELISVEIVQHRNGQGAAGEAVVDSVLSSQTLQVDAVAGATYSSRCILFAIADALKDVD